MILRIPELYKIRSSILPERGLSRVLYPPSLDCNTFFYYLNWTAYKSRPGFVSRYSPVELLKRRRYRGYCGINPSGPCRQNNASTRDYHSYISTRESTSLSAANGPRHLYCNYSIVLWPPVHRLYHWVSSYSLITDIHRGVLELDLDRKTTLPLPLSDF